jgi:hypothetical protein
MTLGWTCSRCGTRYGVLARHSPRRWRFSRCLAGECPTTPRALLWRVLNWKLRRLLVSDDAYMRRPRT